MGEAGLNRAERRWLAATDHALRGLVHGRSPDAVKRLVALLERPEKIRPMIAILTGVARMRTALIDAVSRTPKRVLAALGLNSVYTEVRRRGTLGTTTVRDVFDAIRKLPIDVRRAIMSVLLQHATDLPTCDALLEEPRLWVQAWDGRFAQDVYDCHQLWLSFQEFLAARRLGDMELAADHAWEVLKNLGRAAKSATGLVPWEQEERRLLSEVGQRRNIDDLLFALAFGHLVKTRDRLRVRNAIVHIAGAVRKKLARTGNSALANAVVFGDREWKNVLKAKGWSVHECPLGEECKPFDGYKSAAKALTAITGNERSEKTIRNRFSRRSKPQHLCEIVEVFKPART